MLLHKLFCNLFIVVRCGPIANKGGYLFKVAWLMMTAGRREEGKTYPKNLVFKFSMCNVFELVCFLCPM
jgi:hypothetical protein